MGRLRHEAGQTIVLVAVLLPLFLGLGALAVDIGYWYVVKKTAQDAADAAALAAAAELPDKFAAEQAASTYVVANMPEASWTVEYPYVPDVVVGDPSSGIIDPPAVVDGTPDPTKIQVTVEHHADTFFGRIFGMFEPVVASRAVAERLNSDGDWAIFAYSDECTDALAFDGNNTNITGYLRSNGRFAITVDGAPPRWWALRASTACNASINPPEPPGIARFGSTDYDTAVEFEPRVVRGTAEWPTWFTVSQLGLAWPDGCPATWTWTDSNTTIPSGVYCARDEIRIDADNVRGRITLVAPKISVSGDHQDFAPYIRRLLFFVPPNSTPDIGDDGPGPAPSPCDPDPAADMELGGERYMWTGTIFSPCGRVHIAVGESRDGNPQIVGTILARQVSIDGDGLSMVGRSNFDVNPEVALAE